ncbi:MAG: M67 family metallopeptidase [Actinomycetota bacterium]|nr:M67 family metallopeptidase [Actinomycetota bacterium]
MRIASELLAQMVAHAREEAPEECCGMVAVTDGQMVEVHPATNSEASPFRFVIDAREQLQILDAIEAADQELGAIYHSHTRTPPRPSQTDINFAAAWPGVLWVIVGLADGQEEVRTWRIDGGQVREVELVVQ